MPVTPVTVTAIVVDDHPLFCRGLQLLLPAVSDGRVRVAGVTADAAAAAPLARRLRPDIALVDLAMPEPGGLRAIAAIRRTEPRVRVLALSGIVDPDLALAALEAGAEGYYLPKGSEPELLVAPILAAVEGWSVVPPETLRHLMTARPGEGLMTEISANQRRLWRFIAEGRPTSVIAQELHVSERTAKRMVAALLRRLGVASRTEAATLAGQVGLLSPNGTHPPGASGRPGPGPGPAGRGELRVSPAGGPAATPPPPSGRTAPAARLPSGRGRRG